MLEAGSEMYRALKGKLKLSSFSHHENSLDQASTFYPDWQLLTYCHVGASLQDIFLQLIKTFKSFPKPAGWFCIFLVDHALREILLERP